MSVVWVVRKAQEWLGFGMSCGALWSQVCVLTQEALSLSVRDLGNGILLSN